MRKLIFTIPSFFLTSLLLLENTYAMHEIEENKVTSQKKLKFIPQELTTINFEFNLKEQGIVVRPFEITDVTETYIDRFCTYDPSDPMDEEKSYDTRPSIEEEKENIHQLLTRDIPQKQAIYGIFNSEDNQILGSGTILGGSYFYNAFEITFQIYRDFRSQGLGSAVASEFLKNMKETVSNIENCPGYYIEGSINDDNIASQKAAIKTGMIKFLDASSEDSSIIPFYYPLQEGLGLPTLIPPKNKENRENKITE